MAAPARPMPVVPHCPSFGGPSTNVYCLRLCNVKGVDTLTSICEVFLRQSRLKNVRLYLLSSDVVGIPTSRRTQTHCL